MMMLEKTRQTPLNMTPEAFRSVGYQTIDMIATYLSTLSEQSVTQRESTEAIRALVGDAPLPTDGMPSERLLTDTANLLLNHGTHTGHPRFWGYIQSSAAPIGILGDLLASALNANVGAWQLSPVATEIEKQTVGWIADMINFPASEGLMLSGGNMANITAFWAARHAKAEWDIQREGVNSEEAVALCAYAAEGVHTWMDKAADLSGIGLDAVRHIPVDGNLQLDTAQLRQRIEQDIAAGHTPFMVVATAGTTSTGAIDPLADVAAICKEFDLWFHIDGAYGAFAALLPEYQAEFNGLQFADSIALDPHKWLYVPLEAGCLLVKDSQTLTDAFSFHPDYYHLDRSENAPINYYEYGPQNSRGFRALKVWLAIRQAGRQGYEEMIREDIALAKRLFEQVDGMVEFEAISHNLSIAAFRYVPAGFPQDFPNRAGYLNQLNTEILEMLQQSGDAFVSNAVIDGNFVLRLCIVNFRTSWAELEKLPALVQAHGRAIHARTMGSSEMADMLLVNS